MSDNGNPLVLVMALLQSRKKIKKKKSRKKNQEKKIKKKNQEKKIKPCMLWGREMDRKFGPLFGGGKD